MTPSRYALDAARQRTTAALQAETGAPLGRITTLDDFWRPDPEQRARDLRRLAYIRETLTPCA